MPMSWSDPVSVGAAQNKAGINPMTVTTTAAIPANALVIVAGAYDSTSTTTPAAQGVWQQERTDVFTQYYSTSSSNSNLGGVICCIAWGYATNSIASGSEFGYYLDSSITAHTIHVFYFTGVSNGTEFGVQFGTSTAGQPAATISSLPADSIGIGIGGIEANSTSVGSVQGLGSFLASTVTSGGGSASNIGSAIYYDKFSTTQTSITFQPAFSTSSDSSCAFLVMSAPASGFTQTPSDNLGLTDSIAIEFTDSNTDNIGLTDAFNAVPGQSPTDALGLTDSLTTALSIVRTQTDNEGLTDTTTSVVDKVVAQTDAENLTDSVAAPLTIARSVSESENLTDVVAISLSLSFVDSEGLTDSVSSAGNVALPLSESENLTDVVAISRSLTQTDSEGLTDSVVSAGNVSMSAADTESLTDTTAATLAISRTVLDSEGLTDAISLELSIERSIADAANITDSVDAINTYMSRSIWRREFNKRIGV